jgi:hypothetical protein
MSMVRVIEASLERAIDALHKAVATRPLGAPTAL